MESVPGMQCARWQAEGHDLRNPLQGIKHCVGVRRCDYEKNEVEATVSVTRPDGSQTLRVADRSHCPQRTHVHRKGRLVRCAQTERMKRYGGDTTSLAFNNALGGVCGNPERSPSAQIGGHDLLNRLQAMGHCVDVRQCDDKEDGIMWTTGYLRLDPIVHKNVCSKQYQHAPSATTLGDPSHLRRSYLRRAGRIASIRPRERRKGEEQKIDKPRDQNVDLSTLVSKDEDGMGCARRASQARAHRRQRVIWATEQGDEEREEDEVRASPVTSAAPAGMHWACNVDAPKGLREMNSTDGCRGALNLETKILTATVPQAKSGKLKQLRANISSSSAAGIQDDGDDAHGDRVAREIDELAGPMSKQGGIRCASPMSRQAGIHDDDDAHGDRVARERGTPLEPGVERRRSRAVALGDRRKQEEKKKDGESQKKRPTSAAFFESTTTNIMVFKNAASEGPESRKEQKK
ncbi:hypothetical protein R3P38DRAFT_3379488 [Favolaschia claudopus]|uniref:Uncharacterized protein n=1 Tax=Favolaschia claudopus TaxID=2862362 RepID=A0AAV9Z5R6_9AGAR